MNTLFHEQQTLLAHQLDVLARLQAGLRYSLARLPQPLEVHHLHEPEVAERVASMTDRTTKLQDQLAGALRHAHAMLGERYRSFADVVTWAVLQGIIPSPDAWYELRALRNRLTHDYDLEAAQALGVIHAMLASIETMSSMIERFRALCIQSHLLPSPPAAS